ncbi:MAG: lysophospholipid acyltransferase family protein [Anaerolineae bacterium]
MTWMQKLVIAILRVLINILCRVDAEQLKKVPMHGPLILVANHVNFLDVPLLFVYLQPRRVTAFAKIETWENPILGFLFTLFDAIPIRRGEADTTAFRRALAELEAGHILAIAPEGTRSRNGRLQRGRPGAVMLALRTGAPLLPVAYYGGENFYRNLSRLRRTDFHIVVGEPFYVEAHGMKVTREVRWQITDEVMYQLAALLPPAYRGYYSDLSAATERYLRFPPNSESNLRRAFAATATASESLQGAPVGARQG